jgi:hypothetical protein
MTPEQKLALQLTKIAIQRGLHPGLDFAVGHAVEELGELQAALGKTLRWGWKSYNPTLPLEERELNLTWVRREMADVREALDNLEQNLNDIYE